MIIGITGKIGSGKTTLANYLVQEYDFIEYSFAGPLKEIGKIFGFSDQQLYGTQEDKLSLHSHWGISSREFLQKVGTELFRNQLSKVIPDMKIKHTIWADLFKLQYMKKPRHYVISDVRFLDEAKVITELGGIIIRTERKNDVTSCSGYEHVHASETNINKIPFKLRIDNNENTLQEVQIIIDDYLDKLGIRKKYKQYNTLPDGILDVEL